MPAAVSVRTDFSAGELRRLATAARNANQKPLPRSFPNARGRNIASAGARRSATGQLWSLRAVSPIAT
jgi:hypothetical protein